MALYHLRTNFRALRRVVRPLQDWHTDVVYSNSSVLLSGYLAARLLGKPHVWHLREFADLDYDYVPDLGRNAQRRLINRSAGAIAVSNSIREFYRAGPSSRIRVIENGIAWEAEVDRQRRKARRVLPTDTDYTFALVGMIHPAKGQETAVRALYHLSQAGIAVKLILAGSGRALHIERLERLIAELGLQSRVELRGFVTDVFSVYQDADAVLMCSTNEGMGRVTAEAMATCRPVIGFRGKGGTEEIIEHERTGLLYDGGSEALASHMLRFVENPSWARQLGDHAWHAARSRFTIEKYAASVFEVLSEVTAGNGEQQAVHPILAPKAEPDRIPAVGFS